MPYPWSERAMLVGRVGRSRLPHIPQLDDSTSLDPEEVDRGHGGLARCQADSRVNGHERSFRNRSEDLQRLGGMLAGIVLHRGDEARRISTDERVVVDEVRGRVPLQASRARPTEARVRKPVATSRGGATTFDATLVSVSP